MEKISWAPKKKVRKSTKSENLKENVSVIEGVVDERYM